MVKYLKPPETEILTSETHSEVCLSAVYIDDQLHLLFRIEPGQVDISVRCRSHHTAERIYP